MISSHDAAVGGAERRMKWRCPECGKPHERNDPPCDNCGHHSFEKAVVPQASADDDREQFVWACPKCGREHQRNSPPCSRCGYVMLEKEPLEYDDIDMGTTASYRELAGSREVFGAVAVLAMIVVSALALTGVVSIPGLTPAGQPTVENVPGNATHTGSLSLDEVEAEIVADINERRRQPIENDEQLDELITYINKRYAKNIATEEQRQIDSSAREKFGVSCNPDLHFSYRPEPLLDRFQNPEDAAEILGPNFEERTELTGSDVRSIGIDIHQLPDGGFVITRGHC